MYTTHYINKSALRELITPKGDDGSIGEELLQGTNELDLKCLCIENAVIEKIFSLVEALEHYQVTEEDYTAYQKLKNP